MARRYLIVSSSDGINLEWVAQKCSRGESHDGAWDRFTDAQGRTFALRCPASLSQEELLRCREDDPPGSYLGVLREFREAYWSKRKAGRKRERLKGLE